MTDQHSRRRILQTGTTVLIAGAGLGGCLDSATNETTPTTNDAVMEIGVGSWNFTEQEILGYLLYELLSENTSHTVIDSIRYGNNDETWEGFKQRDFHTYVDYTGTLWFAKEPVGEQTFADPQAQYEAVKEQMETAHDLRLLAMTSFENSFSFTAKPATLDTTGIENLSDVAAYVNAGNYDLQIAMQRDFYGRADGWSALTDHYGFDSAALQEWETEHDGVVQTDIGLEASMVVHDQVDIGLVYTTRAVLIEHDLELIADDRDFWPPYNLVPVIATAKATEPVVREINKIPATLTDAATMQRLNARVDIDGESPQAVARSFLQENEVI